jgi:hypothetical protein
MAHHRIYGEVYPLNDFAEIALVFDRVGSQAQSRVARGSFTPTPSQFRT